MCSIAFTPLARVVARGAGHLSLPIAVIPHPVGDPDPELVRKKGREIAAECARVLSTPSARLEREFEDKKYPLPPACAPK